MQGTRVAEKQEFQETFAVRRSSQVGCNSLDVAITTYRGPLDQPAWMDSERGTCSTPFLRIRLSGFVVDQFSTLCTVRADTTKLARSLSPKRSAEGSLYYTLEIKVILMFGLTELTAQVSWMENVRIPRMPLLP